jgi:hypothetical protein
VDNNTKIQSYVYELVVYRCVSRYYGQRAYQLQIGIKILMLKGTSHEMDFSFEEMYGKLEGLNRGWVIF